MKKLNFTGFVKYVSRKNPTYKGVGHDKAMNNFLCLNCEGFPVMKREDKTLTCSVCNTQLNKADLCRPETY